MIKKKVLFVITKSNWGGAQRYVFDLATHLSKENFDAVVALGGNGLLKEKLEAAGIRTISLESMQRDVSFFAEEKAIRELRRLFKKEQPDVVHLNSSKAGGLGALAARLAGVKTIIFTAHGWPFWEKLSSIARALIWYFSWLTALFSHKVIVISKYDLKVARQMPFCGHKIVLIYNGIDANAPLGDGDVIRKVFPPNVHITGTVGELNKNKNQITLLEEAKQNPNLYVAIVGEGEDRAMLENKIKEYDLGGRVKLFGFMPASEVLKGFDTFALPSLKEGLPYVLLEAKAAGLPIVANPVGGIPEILQGKIEDFSLERMVKETAVLY
jgi:glycosyltransferase involved in cell wall biosynthesis